MSTAGMTMVFLISKGVVTPNALTFRPPKNRIFLMQSDSGTVLENVVLESGSRLVEYGDSSITQNTRASYPIEKISSSKIPCLGGHPENIVFLTCDAFGILPPVSKLTPAQAMYHFISGYTAKVAGTEMGVTEPQATFSACFGEAFMVWHPSKYAELLAEKIRKHGSSVWLVNTGWSGGGYGTGKRISLSYTRAIINAIHDGSLSKSQSQNDPIFGFEVVLSCEGIPDKLLNPRETWESMEDYDSKAKELAQLFVDNFEQYKPDSSPEIVAAAPKI